ncbi:hypothetical protein [Nocardia sp. NPDC059228]|uniref:hypothetical protein n=1 Tax=Nocardia sp. NPDC059228 TaxID=3346777 RepID=UPI00367590DD
MTTATPGPRNTQDLRRWIGTTVHQTNLDTSTPAAIFPNANVIVQRDELAGGDIDRTAHDVREIGDSVDTGSNGR